MPARVNLAGIRMKLWRKLRADLRCARVGGQCCLGRSDDGGERGRLGDREVSEDTAVNLDAGQVQSLDEAVVGEAVCA